MTDRLTKFNPETNQYEYKERAKTQEEFNAQRKAVIQRLGEFEDKIEQGKIVELPCKVGSEAYHLTSADTLDELGVAEIFNGKVCSFSKDEKGLWIFCRYDNGLTYWYKETDIGTKLFFDRATAEAKLREMEGIDNEKTDK